jgi:hypothetical protein
MRTFTCRSTFLFVSEVIDLTFLRRLAHEQSVLVSEMKVLNQEQTKLTKNITALKDAVQKKEDILYNSEFDLGEENNIFKQIFMIIDFLLAC